jgi:hypothetical protein
MLKRKGKDKFRLCNNILFKGFSKDRHTFCSKRIFAEKRQRLKRSRVKKFPGVLLNQVVKRLRFTGTKTGGYRPKAVKGC